jgi:hypothetical protein
MRLLMMGLHSGRLLMDKFVAGENIKHYRRLLAGALDETKRRLVLNLLREEESGLAKPAEPLSGPGMKARRQGDHH